MHEASIVSELLLVVEEQAAQHALVRVDRLSLRVGALRAVVPELLRAAFEIMSRGTVAEGAELAIESVPLVGRCGLCQQDCAIEEFVFYCPKCGSPLSDILSGKEMDLVELQGEQA